MGRTIRMLSPVVCTHCGAVYDLCAVKPIVRHDDCTTFKTPCCHRNADDRRWKAVPDIRGLRQDDFMPMDVMGNMLHVRIIDPEEVK
jgi:hypothetical protein